MAGRSDTPDGTPAGPDDINSRLAEIAAELASEARFKEPSAAERARARVTAVRPAAKEVRRRFGRRRRLRKAEELRRPVDSAGAPAPPRPPRQSRWARRAASRAVPDRGYADATMPSVARSVTTIVIIVALLVGVSIGGRYLFRHFGAASAPRQTTSTTPTIKASTSPPFTASDAFTGSGAEFYANGAQGIVPGATARADPFTASQVASAYATVKQLLIASNLTRSVLLDGSPAAFASLLTRRQRTALLQPTAADASVASRSWLTTFVSGTGIVGNSIAVSGPPMTAVRFRYQGRTVLQVKANDIFVYPVQLGTKPATRTLVVVHVFATVLFARWDDPHGALEPLVLAMTPYDFNVQCEATDGRVHPWFPGPGEPAPQGPPAAAYSPDKPRGICYQGTSG